MEYILYLIKKIKEKPFCTSDDLGHIQITERLNVDDWVKLGKPHSWMMVEKFEIWEVWIDTAYGSISLYNGIDVYNGKWLALSEEGVIALDIGYYGCKSYLHIPAIKIG